ncbi:MAG: hypothetical protein ACJ757_12935 [Gaiellaceae bacterium]
MIGRITQRLTDSTLVLGNGELVPLFAEVSQGWQVDFDDGRAATVVVRRAFIETYEQAGLEQTVVDRAAELVAVGIDAARL